MYSRLTIRDTQYWIPTTEKASAMYMASPSDTGAANYVAGVSSAGPVHGNRPDYNLGFRPLVCLNSNVTLKAVEGGFEIE